MLSPRSHHTPQRPPPRPAPPCDPPPPPLLSAITLADGYGNLDDHFTQFLKYISWAGVGDSRLRTNDQWLSLTDQMRLGVRAVELDTHWVSAWSECGVWGWGCGWGARVCVWGGETWLAAGCPARRRAAPPVPARLTPCPSPIPAPPRAATR